MTGVPHPEAASTRAGIHLLQYLQQVSDAGWSLSSAPCGTSYPITAHDATPLGYLCRTVTSEPTFHHLGAAVAHSLGLLMEAERCERSSGSMLGIEAVDPRMTAYFQPIVELRTGQVVAVEALARLQTTDGVISPEGFLGGFSTGAAMLGLFDRMLDSAVQVLADCRHRVPDLSAAVNLEFAAVADHGLAELVERRLTESGTPGEAVTIELNERLAYQLTDIAREQLRAVAELGVKLVLDDIPSSFHALAQLDGVPMSGAKLDRRFVKQLHRGHREVAEVVAIFDRARTDGLEMIAEGIETQRQCEQLVDLGCNFGQGYLFAVPQPPASLQAVLDAPLVGSW